MSRLIAKAWSTIINTLSIRKNWHLENATVSATSAIYLEITGSCDMANDLVIFDPGNRYTISGLSSLAAQVLIRDNRHA